MKAMHFEAEKKPTKHPLMGHNKEAAAVAGVLVKTRLLLVTVLTVLAARVRLDSQFLTTSVCEEISDRPGSQMSRLCHAKDNAVLLNAQARPSNAATQPCSLLPHLLLLCCHLLLLQQCQKLLCIQLLQCVCSTLLQLCRVLGLLQQQQLQLSTLCRLQPPAAAAATHADTHHQIMTRQQGTGGERHTPV